MALYSISKPVGSKINKHSYQDENTLVGKQALSKGTEKTKLSTNFEINLPRRTVLSDVSNVGKNNADEKDTKKAKRSFDESNLSTNEEADKPVESKFVKKLKVYSKNADPSVETLQKDRVSNVDDHLSSNPLMAEEYAPEIFEYIRKLDLKCLPNPKYMDQQKELTWKMREILNEWLVEIHSNFCLMPETLYLAVNIIDRFLSRRSCSLSKFQLTGITALLIASKYEEVMCPSIQNFVYMTDGAFTVEDVCVAERYMLNVLNFDLSYPSPLNFLRKISQAEGYDAQTRTLGKYLTEIYLFDHDLLRYPMSKIAAAAMYLSRRLLRRGPWTPKLVESSGGYEEHELKEIAYIMLHYHNKPLEHKAFFQKYSSKRFLKASIFVHQLVRQRYSVNRTDDDDLQSEPSSSLTNDGH
ncbi:G1/S-specific B-type cyclin Cig2 [Schizosaccharomyces pombe]|uniref:G2/mitotic-specific cyclin cig2 n=1 Tax=Schizosaccharomyces pombe (strain 972 / ATCC 24843) TaxID=284812 RepID=CG22_SCHPO|nr:G1/S-specific B-type cyclin Cig2 [Schizosaccharomyces pombe]P36630.2 RecName: Full=G2/mitotic-specific cyclin cig2 [Schizosaccharomyces pombe 972h-]BAA05943.1 CYC17 [Schizosaccharomyces pombe]CAC21469.1 G1/S-specific B-type cyclin Cig2 [Schizosaccharomyces pombe]|eukprot:NP_593889.1 G1/S-specific B-type cyclin Cig2 [Schizosaccharomyces pombe]